MAISENASLRVSRQPESGGELSESTDRQVSLPSKPLIKIRASKRWTPLDLREIWAHRELLYFLVWRDLKVRYKQTLLGVSWVVLQPILMTLVFAVFLGKILARIVKPTSGEVDIYGRVGSLLQVGTGFHPDLTGRENIFLNGAILGMKATEIRRNFNEIVAFSEVGRFLDTAVKYYSSGMYLRLAFAIAAHL